MCTSRPRRSYRDVVALRIREDLDWAGDIKNLNRLRPDDHDLAYCSHSKYSILSQLSAAEESGAQCARRTSGVFPDGPGLSTTRKMDARGRTRSYRPRVTVQPKSTLGDQEGVTSVGAARASLSIGDYTSMWIASGWLTIRSVHTASRLSRTAPDRALCRWCSQCRSAADRAARHRNTIRSSQFRRLSAPLALRPESAAVAD